LLFHFLSLSLLLSRFRVRTFTDMLFLLVSGGKVKV